MINQADLHELTDRLAKQFDNIIDAFGLNNTTTAANVYNICDSLNFINSDIIDDSGDKDLIAKMNPTFTRTESNLDADLLGRFYYASIVSSLENILRGTSVQMGYDQFALDNSGTRYASTFLRLAKLQGYGLLTPIWIYYDTDDTLGTFVLSGSTSGAWTASTFAWDSDVLTMYGVQPSSSIEIEAKTITGGNDIDVVVRAVESVTESIIILTGTIPSGSAIGTAVTLTSSSSYGNHVKSISSVSVTDGTAADEFYINFKPIRVIALD